MYYVLLLNIITQGQKKDEVSDGGGIDDSYDQVSNLHFLCAYLNM